MPLSKMHKICMNYPNRRSIGQRKEKLQEICILMGVGEAWRLYSRRSFLLCLELHSGGAALCCMLSAKTALASLALQAAPPSLVCDRSLLGEAGVEPSGRKVPKLRQCQGTGVICFSTGLSRAGGTVTTSWPLGGAVAPTVRSTCSYILIYLRWREGEKKNIE